jgi:hypothetical protein
MAIQQNKTPVDSLATFTSDNKGLKWAMIVVLKTF